MRLEDNLTKIREEAKMWKFKTIDQVMFTKKQFMARLKGIQTKMQCSRYHTGLVQLENKLQKELDAVLKKEELVWY